VLNCRSILPKLDKLVCLRLAGNPAAVRLTETWLCSDIVYIQILHIPNYTIFLDFTAAGTDVVVELQSTPTIWNIHFS